MFSILRSIKEKHPFIIFTLFSLISLLYYKYKIVGLILSVIALILGFLLHYTDDYSITTMIKIYLVILASFVMFYKLNVKTDINVNYFGTLLLVLNVLVMLFRFFKTPFYKSHIKNNYLLFAVILVLLSTPFVNISNNKVSLVKVNADVDLYVVLYTLSFLYFFKIYPWKQNMNLHIISLILPFISHFMNNKWLETRCICLCFLFIYDILDGYSY